MRLVYVLVIFLMCLSCRKDRSTIYSCQEYNAISIDSIYTDSSVIIVSDSLVSDIVYEFLGHYLSAGYDIEFNTLRIKLISQGPYADGGYFCGHGSFDAVSGVGTVILNTECPKYYYSQLSLERLVYHELGHCLLGKSHNQDLLPNRLARSIMFGGSKVVDFYVDHPEYRDYYIRELFYGAEAYPCWSVSN